MAERKATVVPENSKECATESNVQRKLPASFHPDFAERFEEIEAQIGALADAVTARDILIAAKPLKKLDDRTLLHCLKESKHLKRLNESHFRVIQFPSLHIMSYGVLDNAVALSKCWEELLLTTESLVQNQQYRERMLFFVTKFRPLRSYLGYELVSRLSCVSHYWYDDAAFCILLQTVLDAVSNEERELLISRLCGTEFGILVCLYLDKISKEHANKLLVALRADLPTQAARTRRLTVERSMLRRLHLLSSVGGSDVGYFSDSASGSEDPLFEAKMHFDFECDP